MCFHEGEGTPPNHKKAEECYKKAADQGFAQAQHNLASLYYTGAVPQHHKEAVRLLTAAALQDNQEAQHDLGLCYLTGAGVPKQDPKQAAKWLRQAAQGHTPSIQLLSDLERQGIIQSPSAAATTLEAATAAIRRLTLQSSSTANATSKPKPRCNHCGKPASDHKGAGLFKCSRCKAVCYCSRECQAADWRKEKGAHRHACRQLAFNGHPPMKKAAGKKGKKKKGKHE